MKLSAAREKHNEAGFTLIELIIVIAIIGILIAIAIPVYGGFRENAKAAPMKADLNTAAKQMEMAFNETGAYPTALPTTFNGSDNVSIEVTTGGAGAGSSDLPAGAESFVIPNSTNPSSTSSYFTIDPPNKLAGADIILPETRVNFSVNPSNGGRLSAEISCDYTVINSPTTLICPTSAQVYPQTGYLARTSNMDISGNLPAICEQSDGTLTFQPNYNALNINWSSLPASDDGHEGETGFAYTWPTYTTSNPLCDSGELVGLAFSGVEEQPWNGLTGGPGWAFGWGMLAENVTPSTPGEWCLEATSSKTDQIWSWHKNGGLKEGRC